MARVDIPVQQIGNASLELEDITETAADATNDHSFVNNGRTLLLIKNGSGSPHTTTIVSQKTELRGSPDKSIVTAAGLLSIAGPFPTDIFNDSTGACQIDISADTSITFATIVLPTGTGG